MCINKHYPIRGVDNPFMDLKSTKVIERGKERGEEGEGRRERRIEKLEEGRRGREGGGARERIAVAKSIQQSLVSSPRGQDGIPLRTFGELEAEERSRRARVLGKPRTRPRPLTRELQSWRAAARDLLFVRKAHFRSSAARWLSFTPSLPLLRLRENKEKPAHRPGGPSTGFHVRDQPKLGSQRANSASASKASQQDLGWRFEKV